MTISSPSTETVQFIIKIIEARPLPVSEVARTISAIRSALGQLERGRPIKAAPIYAAASQVVPIPRAPITPAPVVLAPIAPRPPRETPVPAAAPEIVAAPVIVRRPRGRPRRIPLPIEPVIEAVPVEPEAPVQPRLLRRADVTATDYEHAPSPVLARTPSGTVRGVVKWYDGRSGKGALRLTGVSGDVALEAAILEQSGVKRIYKDQEIEATVQDVGGRIRVVSLALPGRGNDRSSAAAANQVLGTARRQPRPVMVEIKPGTSRKLSARAEAEQVLGGVGRTKITRRVTP